MAQIALPIGAKMVRLRGRPITLHLKGGTDCDFAPPVRVQDRVFGALLQHFNFELSVDQKRNGFNPAGKGEAVFTISDVRSKTSITPFPSTTTKERITVEQWYSVGGNDAAEESILRELQKSRKVFERITHEKLDNVKITTTRETRPGIGLAAGVYAYFEDCPRSVTRLARLKKGQIQSFKMGREVETELISILDSINDTTPVLDRHHSDQVLIYAALGTGTVEYECAPEKGQLPTHVKTAAYVINEFCGEDTVTINDLRVTVRGIGNF